MATKPVTWTPTASAALERLEGKLFASTTEAGAVLGYDHRVLQKAAAAGEIPSIKVGATYRISVAWIREQVRLGGGNAA